MTLTGEKARIVLELIREIEPLRAELKRCSMIYQYDEKCYAAKRQGLPHDIYHELPYAEWAAIRDVWGFNGAGT